MRISVVLILVGIVTLLRHEIAAHPQWALISLPLMAACVLGISNAVDRERQRAEILRRRSLQETRAAESPTVGDSEPRRLASLSDDEVPILRGMIGWDLISVEYEESCDVESAYFRFASGLVEIATVRCDEPLTAVAFPWRLSPRPLAFADAPDDLKASHTDLGRIDAVRVYADGSEERVERMIAFELESGSTLWLSAAGGDFVETRIDAQPAQPTDFLITRDLR